MKRIIRLTEGELVKLIKRVINEGEIDEIDIEGTYLEKPNTDYYRKKDLDDAFVKDYGNVFKDEPITRSEPYGLKFINIGKNLDSKRNIIFNLLLTIFIVKLFFILLLIFDIIFLDDF